MKNPTMVRTIRAEQGTSMIVDRKRPVSEAVSDMTAEAVITEQKRRKNTSAVMIGSDSIDMSSMIPTRRMVRTMHTAVSTVMTTDMNRTGSPMTAAKSRSNAVATMLRYCKAKNRPSIMANAGNL